MATFGKMPISQSISLTFWSYLHGTHRRVLKCVKRGPVGSTRAPACTQPTNWFLKRHGAVISALVPHHLLLMVVIN